MATREKIGLDVANVKVGTSPIDMYSKIGEIGSARLVFSHMLVRNRVSWNTMRNGQFGDAVKLFDEMPERVSRDAIGRCRS